MHPNEYIWIFVKMSLYQQKIMQFLFISSAGSVILKYTGHPVKEGSDVNLQCINKKNEEAQITDFFKDGLLLKTHFENVLTLQNVSKSNEGLYKCSISGAGDSAESWLSVVNSREGE